MDMGTVRTELIAERQAKTNDCRAWVECLPSEWAIQNFGQVDLGDKRLNNRAIEIAARMVAHPEESLPNQMESRAALRGAYGLLNNDVVNMESLLAPHCRQTLAAAGRAGLVLMVEDTTELDYSAHRSKTGLGPIGDGRGRGLLLHSTLAIVPEGRQVLGLAHAQVVLRQAAAQRTTYKRAESPEGQLWEVSARDVGRPPEDVTWVHVSDSASDIFGYMADCVDRNKHFVVRAFHNRVLQWDEETAQAEDEVAHHLIDYVRSMSPHPGTGYDVQVAAHQDKRSGTKKPARTAHVVVGWTEVTIPSPRQVPGALRNHPPIKAWVVRVWEPEPPPGSDAVEWILITSLMVGTVEDAYRIVDYYTCRWLVEDYHQCLKTGCRVEHTQLDDGADIRRLLGFAAPIAVRLLQLRQTARYTPEMPAAIVVDPLMVAILAYRQKRDEQTMTIAQFWQGVAQMGGHQGRRSDGPPGWRTIWKGWRYLSDLAEGAHLAAKLSTSQKRRIG